MMELWKRFKSAALEMQLLDMRPDAMQDAACIFEKLCGSIVRFYSEHFQGLKILNRSKNNTVI